MNETIFAHTPNDPAYPPYINVARSDGGVRVTIRGDKMPHPTRAHDVPGATVSIDLPTDVAADLAKHLASAMGHAA